MRLLPLLLPLTALAAPALRARTAPGTALSSRLASMRRVRQPLAAPKADAALPAKEETAVEKATPKPKEGLEALYGGLYDNQVFTEYGWDPWNIGKKATKDQLLMFREAELVHGRVAMLGAWGILAAERWHPLFNSPDGTAMQQAAYILQKYPAFWLGAGLMMGAVELLRAKKVFKNGGAKGSYIFRPYSADAMTIKDGVEPGDIGWDPLGIKPTELEGEGGLLERQNQEINNGRLAMLAAAGLLAAEAATGVPQG
mmetsp:Transcript_11189/g.27508  ORF Transcript_11189/g.27508 Transcript_11189/m.27508 type:complete len:256 (-) Transcript_11189:265-1032(-)|eukprot:CAMPEP_0114510970 /NCGR_PEP_ID=MMETSP0109-20121206/14096_1 /TAXON_ID=29199 /ORGANISM="Chlorarachnion reptans, Strain CCCM449" /LENGTH=255 /DNA_ID=CAMNT_0001690363 /DNA_START=97 /DNA_END=864 /DNA_ORIENTATION=+